MKRKKRRISRRILRWLIWRALCIIVFVAKFLPYRYSNATGSFLGSLVYQVSAGVRRITIENLRMVFGKTLSDARIREIARGVFINQGQNIIELLSIGELDKKKRESFFSVEGEEHLRSAVESGRGVIIVTGHIGNWETSGMYLSSLGYNLNAIAAPVYDDRIDDLIVQLRKNYGINTITRKGKKPLRQILSLVKQGGILGILIDQDIKADGVFVKFFGRDAFTPSGIISLGLKKGLLFVPIYSVRKKNGKNCTVIGPCIDPVSTGDKRYDLINLTQLLTNWLEDAIKANPDQWVWMHKRWKTKK